MLTPLVLGAWLRHVDLRWLEIGHGRQLEVWHGELRQPLPLDVGPLRHHPVRECPRQVGCLLALRRRKLAVRLDGEPTRILARRVQPAIPSVLGEEDVIGVSAGDLREEGVVLDLRFAVDQLGFSEILEPGVRRLDAVDEAVLPRGILYRRALASGDGEVAVYNRR